MDKMLYLVNILVEGFEQMNASKPRKDEDDDQGGDKEDVCPGKHNGGSPYTKSLNLSILSNRISSTRLMKYVI
jgi:hypothetical protein